MDCIYQLHDGTKPKNNAIVQIENSDIITLFSYGTKICSYTESENKFRKYWSGYSKTTMEHINIFRKNNALEKLTKKEWLKLDTEREI